MKPYEIIKKKRDGNELSPDEIKEFIRNFIKGDIADYQMSAFLMAVWFKKMTARERSILTSEMQSSGHTFDLSDIPGIKIDKHSTGGIGDGTSLALAPLVTAAGGIVPMMSGRGLGHTGGTLDKLESIPGYNIKMNLQTLKNALRKCGAVIMGQTENVAPADKKMYALRDVTATVDSIDLISASIMSKKLAEGMDALVLDVKTGNGAFMKTWNDSVELAKSMIEIGETLGKKMFAYITDMNQPLGTAIGNSLEMIQAIEILKGNGAPDITKLILILGARMLVLSNVVPDIEQGELKIREMIDTGKGIEKLKEMIEIHSGDPSVIDNYSLFPQATIKEDIISPADGYISSMDTYNIGMSVITLGGGREKVDSPIDYSAGYILNKKLGDKIRKGDPISSIQGNDKSRIEKAKTQFLNAVQISENQPEIPPLIWGEVTLNNITQTNIPRP